MTKLNYGYWRMELINLTELTFMDDMTVPAEAKENLQYNLNIYTKRNTNKI